MDILGWVTETASSLPPALVWSLGGLFALLESGMGLGFFIPGETIVLLLSASVDTPYKAAILFACVTAGASAGDHVGYLLGRRFGPRLRETRLIRRLGQTQWDRAVAVLERRGAAAVFFTRLVPVVRTLTPAAAGTARVPYRRFLPASLAGAATWSVLYVGVGYLMRSSLDAVQAYLGNVGWILVAIAAAAAALVVVVRQVRARRGAGTSTAPIAPAGALDPRDAREPASVRRTVRDRLDGRAGARALFIGRFVVVVAAAAFASIGLPFTTGALLAVTIAAKPLQTRLRRGRERLHWTEPTLDRATALLVTTGFTIGSFLPWQLVVLLLIPEALIGVATALALRGVLPLPVSGAERLRAATQLIGLTAISLGLSGILHLPFAVASALLIGVGLLLLLVGTVLAYVVAARQAAALFRVWQRDVIRTAS